MHKAELNGGERKLRQSLPVRPSEDGHVFDGSYGHPLAVVWQLLKDMRREVGPMMRQWRDWRGGGLFWRGLGARIAAGAR